MNSNSSRLVVSRLIDNRFKVCSRGSSRIVTILDFKEVGRFTSVVCNQSDLPGLKFGERKRGWRNQEKKEGTDYFIKK